MWAKDHKWQNLNKNIVQHKIYRLATTYPALAGLTMETFRKNFSAMMEQENVPLDHIDAHQGRYQNSVIKKHYLRDRYRAVKLMRPFMKVFDGEPVLKTVKNDEEMAI